jgi:hypothetical protein
MLAGLSLIAAAFLTNARSRARRLSIGFTLLCAASGLSFAAGLTDTIIAGVHHASGTYTASTGTDAVYSLLLAAAAATAAVAFATRHRKTAADWSSAEHLFGWAAIAATAAVAVAMISSILALIAYSDAGASSSFTVGFGILAGGQAISIAAGVIAAIAFLNAAHRQQEGDPDWLTTRDGMLAVAVTVLAVAFAMNMVGTILSSAAASSNGFDGKAVAGDWLLMIRNLTFACGLAVASIGLFMSWRARTYGTPPRSNAEPWSG